MQQLLSQHLSKLLLCTKNNIASQKLTAKKKKKQSFTFYWDLQRAPEANLCLQLQKKVNKMTTSKANHFRKYFKFYFKGRTYYTVNKQMHLSRMAVILTIQSLAFLGSK